MRDQYDNPLWNCGDVGENILPLSRRKFLTACGLGFGGLSLVDTLFAEKATQHPAKAKRVIHLFLQGGPTHLDTFDYKPEVIAKNGTSTGSRTILGSPFEWERAMGTDIWLPEIFPNLKTVADKMAVINSMETDAPAHEIATQQMHTGSVNFVRPSLGSWVSYGLGSTNKNLPSFVSLRTGGNANPKAFQSAFLPGNFQGTPVNTQLPIDKIIDNIVASKKGSTQAKQIALLRKLQAVQSQGIGRNDELDSRIESFELAYKMQTEAPEAFDISKETKETREMYGETPSGKQFLTARRLVEKGVRFVQLYNGSWDHHSDIKGATARKASEIDKPLAALVKDLEQRGMLKDTLIIVSGEFGRTVHRDNVARGNYGRAHWHKGFSSVMIGGGVKGGMRYGATDELGQNAVVDNMHIHDFHATILHLLGFDHEQLTYRYGGRDFRLTDVHGEVAHKIIA